MAGAVFNGQTDNPASFFVTPRNFVDRLFIIPAAAAAPAHDSLLLLLCCVSALSVTSEI